MPISAWTPTIAVNTAPSEDVADAADRVLERRRRSRRARPTGRRRLAEARRPCPRLREQRRGWRRRSRSRRAPPTIAMFSTFSPSADSPPSAKNSPWTSSTSAMQIAPGHGPTSTVASTPPSRWPLVPAATGKFSIWTANTKAATRPASGACLSSIVSAAFFSATPTPPAEAPAAASDVPALMNPSGMCIDPSSGRGSRTSLQSHDCNTAHSVRGCYRPSRDASRHGSVRESQKRGVST